MFNVSWTTRRAVLCLTDEIVDTHAPSGNLLYGEPLFEGLTVALNSRHLDGGRAKVLVDMSMGIGKLCIQAFENYRSIDTIVGVELSTMSFAMARQALEVMTGDQAGLGHRRNVVYSTFDAPHSRECRLARTSSAKGVRRLVFRQGDMLTAVLPELKVADIFIAQTWCRLLCSLKIGARVLSFHNLTRL
jgi:hypothetical protein